MLTNLLRPFVIARLLSGLTAVLLCLYGASVAARVLRHFKVGSTSEGQLALERRAELAAIVVQAALVMSVVNLALTVLTADRLTDSLRGAMCGYGVFDASPFGFSALGASVLAALSCALWVVLHRFDLALHRPVLTRLKFIGVLVIAPLLAVDLFLTTRWIFDLDLSVLASCCSLGLDASEVLVLGAGGGPRGLSGGMALFFALAAAAMGIATYVRPGSLSAWLTSSFSFAATLLALPAILWVVAPYAYETPHHMCPFCLLHADVYGIGWPLYGALFCGAALGLGLGVIESQRARADEPAVQTRFLKRLGGWTAAAWLAAVALAAFPIARYAWITGGASLFGGTG